MSTSKIEQLVAMAGTEPRVASLMETLFDFIQAEERVKGANSEETRCTALGEVRSLWRDTISALNATNTISYAYYDAIIEYRGEKQKEGVALTAHTLLDLSLSFRAPVEGWTRAIGEDFSAVAGELIDILEGNTPSGVLKPKKPGRSGTQGYSIGTLAAWKKLILLINYISGRDDMKMDEACKEIGVGHRAFQENQTKVLQKFELDIELFRSKKILGKAISEKKHISQEDQELADEYETALASPEGLNNLRAAAKNIFPENE